METFLTLLMYAAGATALFFLFRYTYRYWQKKRAKKRVKPDRFPQEP